MRNCAFKWRVQKDLNHVSLLALLIKPIKDGGEVSKCFRTYFIVKIQDWTQITTPPSLKATAEANLDANCQIICHR